MRADNLQIDPSLGVAEICGSLTKQRGDSFISVDAMLVTLCASKGNVAKLLREAGLQLKQLEGVIDEMRKGRTIDSDVSDEMMESLAKYATDLTALAMQWGKLDPVIGRDEEVRRTIQILARRTKNNPVLIGSLVSAARPRLPKGLLKGLFKEMCQRRCLENHCYRWIWARWLPGQNIAVNSRKD